MNTKTILIPVLLTLLLTACGPQATAVPTAQPDPTQTPTGSIPTAVIPTSGPAACVAQSGFLPTPDPTTAAAFPPVSENDWSVGPEDARLTIIEYSDFQ